jgi:hypothetical protein
MTNREPTPLSDATLDALLAQAAARPPAPLPEHLHARLIADALAQKPQVAPRRQGLTDRLSQLWQSLGWAPGMAGLATAGVAGLWIGAASPEPVANLSAAFWQGAALVSPDLALLAEEAPFDFADDPLLALLGEE